LVTDAYQNRGLGGVLTDYCLDVARKWGARRLVAETTSDNVRMLALFAKQGFDVATDEHGTVKVSKDLNPS
jgi:acetyltransferase